MKIGVLFDLDGTLLNTLEDLRDGVNYALGLYGYPLRDLEQIRKAIGTGARNLILKSLPEQESQQRVDEVLAVYQKYYAAHSQIKTCPYEGVVEALAQIGKKYPIAIVSNKPDVAVKPLCADYFPGVFARGESDDCKRKPAPDMLLKAMAQIGVEKCVYVGDSDVDVVTAKNVGAPCLSVLWGFRDRACMEAAGGEFFCDDPQNMPAMLDKIIEDYYGK